jgi:predicted metallo-beta-lactamase superfamily hydrolase|uniref:MBL fold metallo-hydrolase n=1 Tax=candidate division WOR-3 bacterium TaxID=2052148 RepID=A0A7C6EBQ6_UNCW3
MRIIPLAFDSLGIRGMATFLDLSSLGGKRIIIDPACALAPVRYNLPPHPKELTKKEEHWQKIVNYGRIADIVIITHYHYDHHNPDFPELFKDKIVIIKNPKENINESQKERAKVFLAKISNIAKEIIIGDGQTFQFNSVEIVISDAVEHGVSSKLGMVFEVCVKSTSDGQKFLFTSDVQGITLEKQLNFILEQNPDTIFADGPMTYLLNYRFRPLDLAHSIKNIIRIINETKVKKFILDHHFLRDLNYRNYLEEVFATNLGETLILTAAEFAGEKNELLEARRQELYRGEKGSD